MQPALTLLIELSDSDVDWLFAAGQRTTLPADVIVLNEGIPVASLYLVLQGLMSVYLASLGNRKVATLGAGQIFGEMSFLEERPASASVKTLEESELLVIPLLPLKEKLDADPGFAARLYKALAIVTSRRLRETLGTLGRWLEDQPPSNPETLRRWEEIANRTQQFKNILRDASKNSAPTTSPSACETFAREFNDFCGFLNKAIGDESNETIDSRDELGARIQRELLPYLMKSEAANRLYHKPRGYAYDVRTIRLLYERDGNSQSDGSLLELCFFNLPPIVAMRRRRDFITDQILKRVGIRAESFLISAISSGPADELFNAFNRLPSDSNVSATLIDHDAEALAAVAAKASKCQLSRNLKLVGTNLFDLASGRLAVTGNQDLVYSISIADQLNEKLLKNLLGNMHKLLKPGGIALIALFRSGNPFRAFMEHILDWDVSHWEQEKVKAAALGAGFTAVLTLSPQEDDAPIFVVECRKDEIPAD